MADQRIRFGEFEFDARALELYRGGERLPVRGKPLLVLAALVERPSDLLTRQELRARLWPGDVHVDFDGNLNAAVRKLREALQDSSTRPAFIETLPGRGYRFIGIPEVSGSDGYPHRLVPVPSRLRRLPIWLTLAAMALGLGVTVIYRELAGGERMTVAVLPFDNLSGDPAQDHVAEGLGTELTTQLGKISGGRVELIAQVPRAVSTDFVVTGSSRRDSTGLYVTASLIRKEGEQIWAESFVCPRQDLFAIQRQLAAKIGERLLAELSVGPSKVKPTSR